MTYFKSKLFLFGCCILMLSVANAQNWEGNGYRNNSSIQYDVSDSVLKAVDIGKAAPVVLDLGCGDGRVTDLVLKHLKASKVIGMDPSQSMLDKANETYKKNSQLKFKTGSFQTLKDYETYDAITTFFALHWVPKDEQALAVKNIANALKKGGVLVASHVIHSKNPTIRSAIQETVMQEKWQAYFPHYQSPVYAADPYELQTLLTENHFRIRRFIAFDYTTQFEDVRAFYNWLNGWSPFKELLGDKHETFWMDVIKTYRAQTHQDNQVASIIFKDPFVEIIAEKIT